MSRFVVADPGRHLPPRLSPQLHLSESPPVLGKILVRYLSRYKWLLVAVLVFQFASAIATLYLPRLNEDIINKGVALSDTAYIWRCLLYTSPSPRDS